MQDTLNLSFSDNEKDNKVSLDDLISKMGFVKLNSQVETKDRYIRYRSINRPALQMTGFFDYFDSKRVQIIGNAEHIYLQTLPREERIKIYEKLFTYNIPCLVFARGLMPDDDLLEEATKNSIPVLSSKKPTAEVITEIMNWVASMVAPVQSIHGVLVDVYGEGILIIGESGIGKSETALELVRRGHRLVADDLVEIKKITDEIVMGSAPAITRHFIELRGIGIIDVKSLYGVESVKESQTIDMVIRIEEWQKEKEYDRIGISEEYDYIMGVKITSHSIPVSPGRNLAIIVEAAAVNNRQKKMGYKAADEFYRRVQENIDAKKTKGNKIDE